MGRVNTRGMLSARKKKWLRLGGFALAPTLIAGTVMALAASAAAIVARSQMQLVMDSQDQLEALYVAETGLNSLLTARYKNPANMCFPFTNNGNAAPDEGYTFPDPAANPNDASVAKGSLHSCAWVTSPGPGVSAVCNAYDEKILPFNVTAPAPFQGPLGLVPNDDTYPGSFKPLAIWPVTAGAADLRGPMNTSGLDQWLNLETPNAGDLNATCTKSGNDCTSAGNKIKRRAQMALFNICNDPQDCVTPPCPQSAPMLQVVTVGEVQRGDKVYRRAVAVDITNPWMYSGVIDKYVDITLMWNAEIRGPLHVNGICDQELTRQDCSAFFAYNAGISLGVGALWADFDSVVSVSFPEDPLNPDDIRSDLPAIMQTIVCDLLGAPACDVRFVHLPVKIPIPGVRWQTFEDRLIQLYVGAAGAYGGDAGGAGAPDRWLSRRRNFYGSSSLYNDEESDLEHSGGGWSWSCADASYVSIVPHGVNRRWADGPWKFIRTCASEAEAISWNPGTFFDVMANTSGVSEKSGPDYRNQSMDLELVWVYTGLNFDNILGGTCNLSNLGACIGTWVDYPKFGFIGSHLFNSNNGNAANAFFVDGHVAMGEPTPWHSCGPNSGGLFGILNWDICLVIGPWVLFGFTILPQILIGMPHWHVGWVKIQGEMLINGQLHLSDKITVEGGSIYATDLIQKAGSSGLKITFDILAFILQIIKCIFFGCADLCIPLVGLCLFSDIIYGVLVAIFGSLTITLAEHDVTLQLIGGNASIPNSGLMYTRKGFTYKAASSVTFTAIMAILSLDSLLGGFFSFGLGFEIANGRLQLDDGGTIAANGVAANQNDGNIILEGSKDIDVQVKDVNGNGKRVGYLFSEGRIRTQEIGEEYKTILGFNTDETTGNARGVFIGNQAFQGRDDCVFHDLDTPVSADGVSRIGPYENATSCLINYGLDILTGGFADFVQKRNLHIQGHVFTGKIHSQIASDMIIQQDSSVLADIINTNYVFDSGNMLMNYYEVIPPQ